MANGNDYAYNDYGQSPDPPHQPLYLERVLQILRAEGAKTVLDAGCGDGNFAGSVAEAGFTMYGVDLSDTGIQRAQTRGVGTFALSSLYEDLTAPFSVENFDAVLSIEVVEHLYAPRRFARRVAEALRPGGVFVVTTPYWGYWKNIALAVAGRIDALHTALWDGGHIKHWSRKTLTILMAEQGLTPMAFHGAGRPIPYLWEGMLLAFRKGMTH